MTVRRQRLETWLNRLVSHHSWHSASADSLCNFLLFGRGAVSPGSWIDSMAPTEAPLDSILSSTLMGSSICESSSNEDLEALAFLKVKLPPEIGACQQLTVKVPQYHCALGGQVTITVPWGVPLGSPLALWFDPKAGTLGACHLQEESRDFNTD